jgi:hypothetical protein
MARNARSVRSACWLALLLLAGCKHEPAVQVPPRVDLTAWPVIGVVEFGGSGRPEYGPLATKYFVEMLHAAQPGARILELGSAAKVLAEVRHHELDFEAVRALGKRYAVDAVFTGELVISEMKPHVTVGQLWDSVHAGASVQGALNARLFETASGASLWSHVSDASAPVGSFSMAKGTLPTVGAVDPNDAYAAMVRQLVVGQSYDFYPTWVQP